MPPTVAGRQSEEDRRRMATTLLEEWSPAQDDLMTRLVAMAGDPSETGPRPSEAEVRNRVPPATAGGRRNG